MFQLNEEKSSTCVLLLTTYDFIIQSTVRSTNVKCSMSTRERGGYFIHQFIGSITIMMPNVNNGKLTYIASIVTPSEPKDDYLLTETLTKLKR